MLHEIDVADSEKEQWGGLMRIQVLYVPGCPNHEAAISSVNEVLRAEKMAAVIEEVAVSDAAVAQALRFPGSPTIRINGVDANVVGVSVCHIGEFS